MRRASPWLASSILLLLAGCGGEAEPPTVGPPLPQTIKARFVPGRSVNVITVTTVDPLALRSAVLTGPGGISVPAYSIDVTPTPTAVLTPAGDAFPPTPGMPTTVRRLNAMVSTALIRLPEPVLYVHDWRDYRIRLRLANPGVTAREVTLPAPAPPPNEGG